VTTRARALLLGGAISALYLLTAVLSAHLDPFGSAPVLDGLAPPPLYRWVDPPAPLTSVNRAPKPAAARIRLDPATGSAAGVFPTPDLQADVALAGGAIMPHAADTSVRLTITPLAPASDVRLPNGAAIAGNVYRIDATYLPSGAPVGSLREPGQVVLAYPLLFSGGGFSDTMLRSTDARTWTAIRSTDSIGRQLVHASVDALGYFAVGQTAIPTGPSAATSSDRTLPIVLAVIALVVGVALVVIALVRRRSEPSSPRRRPPKEDLWDG
jgi:hypothetical protein